MESCDEHRFIFGDDRNVAPLWYSPRFLVCYTAVFRVVKYAHSHNLGELAGGHHGEHRLRLFAGLFFISQLITGTEIESRGYVRFGLAFRRDVLAVNANGSAWNGLGSLFLAWCLNLIKPTQRICIANDTLCNHVLYCLIKPYCSLSSVTHDRHVNGMQCSSTHGNTMDSTQVP